MKPATTHKVSIPGDYETLFVGHEFEKIIRAEAMRMERTVRAHYLLHEKPMSAAILVNKFKWRMPGSVSAAEVLSEVVRIERLRAVRVRNRWVLYHWRKTLSDKELVELYIKKRPRRKAPSKRKKYMRLAQRRHYAKKRLSRNVKQARRTIKALATYDTNARTGITKPFENIEGSGDS